MKALFFTAFAFFVFNSLCAIDVSIHDEREGKLFFLNVTLGFNITVKKVGEIEMKNVLIRNGTVLRANPKDDNDNVTTVYDFHINQLPSSSSFIKTISLALAAQKSKDGKRRYIQEMTLTLTFDASTEIRNWSDTSLTFVVRPPKFPHFQVKSDWQFRCPKSVQLRLCHVATNTTTCSQEKPYDLLDVWILLENTVFNGGEKATHDYSSRIEECPLAYETSKDIGIACIAVFWSIALAFGIWGLVKFLLKRHRKRMD